MTESIGMMDKAYFVGKNVILQWLNELLDVSKSILGNIELAEARKNRAVCYRSRLLCSVGCSLPQHVPLQRCQVGLQE